MKTLGNEKQKSKEEEIHLIIQYWVRTLNIKLGWIYDFEKLVVNYVMFFITIIFIFDTFCSLSKLLNTFIGHTNRIYSIDYSTFDNNQFICSGSDDKTIRVWNIETNQQIQSFNKHSGSVYCVKFSPYHYYNYHQSVICSSSNNIIQFWDFKNNQQF
ncbi:hypothetical protein RFI_29716 [Reticulomyxa filosa]|uniref:WD-40 repeat protein n=1 Tax=Reticulomyxa filosa TaxID=46433 RepID=X6M1A5_RETFI|nr:hypothetical protein RFI_29716 [Reticulomyxa filosa]|eukprot:ETO07674.1 hypothetical protein RFI_29716 [Reticulomyxa filosa]